MDLLDECHRAVAQWHSSDVDWLRKCLGDEALGSRRGRADRDSCSAISSLGRTGQQDPIPAAAVRAERDDYNHLARKIDRGERRSRRLTGINLIPDFLPRNRIA
jgi:hypothetical protein